MGFYDMALLAISQGTGIRRPSMPAGVALIPVGGNPLRAFLVNAQGGEPWYATLDDVVATDWEAAPVGAG